MTEFEISPTGDLLIYKKGYTPEIVKYLIREEKLKGLKIFAQLKEDRLKDLNFLTELDFLQELDITSVDDLNFEPIKNLSLLKTLSINAPGKNEIDFNYLSHLQSLTVNWRPNLKGLEMCKSLSELYLVEFKEKDFRSISGLKQLKRLIVKTGSMVSLEGIHTNSLEFLSLNYCTKLKSIKALNFAPDLKTLEITDSSKIEDYDDLLEMPKLEVLRIDNCKKIKSISFINNFKLLKNLSLLGNTDIKDGDLEPAKRIKDVRYTPRKHYNSSIDNDKIDSTRMKNLDFLKSFYKK